MGWDSPDGPLTTLLSGNIYAILFALFVALSLPLLVHLVLYRSSAHGANAPKFILLGPSGAGKTSLLTLLQRRSSAGGAPAEPALTRTSQTSSTALLGLNPSIPLASNRYRSTNDPSLQETARNPPKYLVIDTPGHGKLRLDQGLSHLKDPTLTGVIFVVDAATFDSFDPSVRDAATYLHDALLLLQKRRKAKGSKIKGETPVLIAANKQDLFTALPPGAVRVRLEKEIEKVRQSRRKGLVAAGASADEDDEEEVLGADLDAGSFQFKTLEDEAGIKVDVVGGAVKGEGEAGKGIRRWEEWIGGCL